MRLAQIENVDLNLFQFDYDLTMMVFFLDANENIYARYGGRDEESADSRQSLSGLRYTMNSVLAMHQAKEKSYAPRQSEERLTVADLTRNGDRRFRFRRCLHCHQVNELMHQERSRQKDWHHDLHWRYPLPDNLGIILQIDKGNIIEKVLKDSPASRVGLKAGDKIRQLGEVPIHSIADAQYALDGAPISGKIQVTFEREDKATQATLKLPKGWRRSDLTWRASMWQLVPSLPLYGEDLTPKEKEALGLKKDRMVFRQRNTVHSRAREAGIQGGDMILGLDNNKLTNMDSADFIRWVRRNYLVGDKVTIDVLRDGKRLHFPITLRNR